MIISNLIIAATQQNILIGLRWKSMSLYHIVVAVAVVAVP